MIKDLLLLTDNTWFKTNRAYINANLSGKYISFTSLQSWIKHNRKFHEHLKKTYSIMYFKLLPVKYV